MQIKGKFLAINNLQELKKATEEASVLLQQIQNYCEENDLNWAEFADAKVRFPRGFIRHASLQRQRFSFISNNALKSNLAYTLILSDVVLWLNLRTDLWGVPSEMLTKLYVFLIASLCESITKEYFSTRCNKGFKPRNTFMFENTIISEDLKNDLDWIWDTRNKMHLFQLDAGEYINDYNYACHERCVKTFRSLISSLNIDFAKQ